LKRQAEPKKGDLQMNTEQAKYLVDKLETGERDTDKIKMEEAVALLRFDGDGDIVLSQSIRYEIEWMVDASTIKPE